MIKTTYKIVFLFSGQGSQYRRMGEKLYNTYPSFAKDINQSDRFIQQYLGQSLIEELYKVKSENFDDLLMTHPAIVAIELAMLSLMKDLGVKPDYVIGNSLGEFAAGVAAGIWTKEMALEAAIEQAKSIEQNSIEGGMLAVLNESKKALQPLLDKSQLYLASENFSSHFTFSGETAHLEAFQQELKNLDIAFSRLPVSYPFHSPLINISQPGFMYYTYTTDSLNKPSKGFISGLHAKELNEIPDDYFWNVVSQPTNFMDFVHYMEAKGPCIYLDLGPSGTSATFVKYNLSPHSNSLTHTIMTPYKRELQQLTSLQKWLKYKI